MPSRYCTFRVDAAQLERWKAAARAAGVTFSAWIRGVADRACDDSGSEKEGKGVR